MNRKIQSTEHLKTGTQFSLLWSATRRSSSSTLLHSHAEILPVCCAPTHCHFNCTASFCSRDAPKNTIAPRPFAQGRTQKQYRAASFCSGTHPKTLSRRVFSPQGRTWTLSTLRPHADLPILLCVLLPQGRTWTSSDLCPGALSLYCACDPSDKNDFKTLRDNPVNQI